MSRPYDKGKPYNFIGYAPDRDPTTPGVITDCVNLIPSRKGMIGAPSANSAGYSALAAACRGAYSALKLDASVRVFAGTAAAIFELSGGSATDRTRAVGGAYTLGTNDRWCFAQFGDTTLAASKTDTLQESTSGAFANISGGPKAACMDVTANFVMLGDYNDGSDTPDGWYCSGLNDHTIWTPAIATQCANGRLRQSAGKIRCIKAFGNQFVAYKDRSMFVGTYIGPPLIWDWQLVPGEIGAVSQKAVANIGTPEDPKHIFMGYDDFYVFNGARPVPIGTDWVKETVFAQSLRARLFESIALHDSQKNLVYFWYAGVDSINPDRCVVYNYRMNRWGRADRQIEMAFEFITPSLTYQGFGSFYTNYGDVDLDDVIYANPAWVSGNAVPAIFDTSHVLRTLDGVSVSSSLTTGDIGDDEYEILLRQVKPRYLTAPNSAVLTNYFRQNLGDSLSTDGSIAQANSRFDVLREARWHRVSIAFDGPVELPGLVLDAEMQGLE